MTPPSPAIPSARRRAGRGVLLVELLVAMLIAAAIGTAAIVSIGSVLRAQESAESRRQAFSRAELASARLAADVLSVVRDGDLFFCRVLITSQGDEARSIDEMLLFCTLGRQARPAGEMSEGIEYEVQYRLQSADAAATGSSGGATVLWRRVDPIPDEVTTGGGIATPITAGVESLSIEASDGENWYQTWDSDRDGMPYAVRIVLRAASDNGKARATARRVIAIDRAPTVYATPAEDLETDAAESGGDS